MLLLLSLLLAVALVDATALRGACPNDRPPSNFHKTPCKVRDDGSASCGRFKRPFRPEDSPVVGRWISETYARDTTVNCCLKKGKGKHRAYCRDPRAFNIEPRPPAPIPPRQPPIGTDGGSSPSTGGVSARERALFDALIAYRRNLRLPTSHMKLSPKLLQVARAHVADLKSSPPRAPCGAHSWSSNGAWTPCCYDQSRPNGPCMWHKPQEIAGFDTNGFENALSGSAPGSISRLSAEAVIDSWDGSPGHRDVIRNAGVWSRYQWRSVAIAANDQFAVAWFAPDEDPSAN